MLSSLYQNIWFSSKLVQKNGPVDYWFLLVNEKWGEGSICFLSWFIVSSVLVPLYGEAGKERSFHFWQWLTVVFCNREIWPSSRHSMKHHKKHWCNTLFQVQIVQTRSLNSSFFSIFLFKVYKLVSRLEWDWFWVTLLGTLFSLSLGNAIEI